MKTVLEDIAKEGKPLLPGGCVAIRKRPSFPRRRESRKK
jgi:hypothetical protein